MEEEKEELTSDVVNDQPVENSKEEGEKQPEADELTIAQVAQIAKATQKGYTIQQQQLAEIKENLSEIAKMINNQSGALEGDDEYVTVSRLRAVLAETQAQAQARQEQANQYIQSTLADLSARGIVSNKDDENSLLNFALKIKEPDLVKASVIWQEVKAAKEEGKTAKNKERQAEGAKIGTSSKTGAKVEQGVNYRDIKKMDWFNL